MTREFYKSFKLQGVLHIIKMDVTKLKEVLTNTVQTRTTCYRKAYHSKGHFQGLKGILNFEGHLEDKWNALAQQGNPKLMKGSLEGSRNP